jgi:biopolymer transport protein ExbB
MQLAELFLDVRDFIEAGGNVLLAIALVTFVMWTGLLERFWYLRRVHPRAAQRVQQLWKARADHASWNAHQIRRLLVSETALELTRGMSLIKTCVALCPLCGLLGTVTGMVEVFDVMAIAGSGNVRGMASGVWKATVPTMAGMVAAISGMLTSVVLERRVRDETDRIADRLVTAQD